MFHDFRTLVNFIFALASFLFGLVFGSFLNVCIYRLPRGLSVVFPGSACPGCGKPVAPYDNIPVLSWVLLGGKCRNCKVAITARYAVVELMTALLFLACYEHLGFSLAALKCAVFGFLLIGLIFTDAETRLLPDRMTLPGLGLGLMFSFLVPVNDLASMVLPGLFQVPISSDVSWRLFSFADSLLGAVIGASFLYGAGAVYLRWRGVEGMGFGDVKLMAMIGSFVGFRLTILTILASSIAGSFFGLWTVFAVWVKRTQRRKHVFHETGSAARRHAWASAQVALRRHQMPFGVFLGSMGLVAFFFGQQLLQWYWRQL
jgi:leader peptidase (prepilin peptidase) / N-methyltransferase